MQAVPGAVKYKENKVVLFLVICVKGQKRLFSTPFVFTFSFDTPHMFNTAIMDCFPDTIISRLHENIKHLVAANEDKQLALEDARTEVKGLKEFIETVSIAGLLHACFLARVIFLAMTEAASW